MNCELSYLISGWIFVGIIIAIHVYIIVKVLNLPEDINQKIEG